MRGKGIGAIKPDEPKPAAMTDKKILTITLPLTLEKRIQKAAEASGENAEWVIRHALQRATRHTELSSRDFRRIAKAVAA